MFLFDETPTLTEIIFHIDEELNDVDISYKHKDVEVKFNHNSSKISVYIDRLLGLKRVHRVDYVRRFLSTLPKYNSWYVSLKTPAPDTYVFYLKDDKEETIVSFLNLFALKLNRYLEDKEVSPVYLSRFKLEHEDDSVEFIKKFDSVINKELNRLLKEKYPIIYNGIYLTYSPEVFFSIEGEYEINKQLIDFLNNIYDMDFETVLDGEMVLSKLSSAIYPSTIDSLCAKIIKFLYSYYSYAFEYVESVCKETFPMIQELKNFFYDRMKEMIEYAENHYIYDDGGYEYMEEERIETLLQNYLQKVFSCNSDVEEFFIDVFAEKSDVEWCDIIPIISLYMEHECDDYDYFNSENTDVVGLVNYFKKNCIDKASRLLDYLFDESTVDKIKENYTDGIDDFYFGRLDFTFLSYVDRD